MVICHILTVICVWVMLEGWESGRDDNGWKIVLSSILWGKGSYSWFPANHCFISLHIHIDVVFPGLVYFCRWWPGEVANFTHECSRKEAAPGARHCETCQNLLLPADTPSHFSCYYYCHIVTLLLLLLSYRHVTVTTTFVLSRYCYYYFHIVTLLLLLIGS